MADVQRFCETLTDVHPLDDIVWGNMTPHLEMISLLSNSSHKKMDYKVKYQLGQSETRTEWECLTRILFHTHSHCGYSLRTE